MNTAMYRTVEVIPENHVLFQKKCKSLINEENGTSLKRFGVLYLVRNRLYKQKYVDCVKEMNT